MLLSLSLRLHGGSSHIDCYGDITGDLRIDGNDVAVFLANFGEVAEPPDEDPLQDEFYQWQLDGGWEHPEPFDWSPLRTRGDLNNDRRIDGRDLIVLITNYGCMNQ